MLQQVEIAIICIGYQAHTFKRVDFPFTINEIEMCVVK